MSVIKKQHYVPQFLLKKFGIGKKNKEKLWVLDKRTENVFQASVSNIGHENRYYQYLEKDIILDPEDLLHNVESYSAPLISKINKLGKLSRNKSELFGLSYFIATQMLRTPQTRNEMENLRESIIAKWGTDIKAHLNAPKTVGEHGPQDAKLSSLKILGEIPDFAKLLQDKVWSLCEAPNHDSYIISDNPVTKHNMVSRKGRGNLGLLNEGIEIYLPISPKYTIQALCPKLSLATSLTPQLSEKYKNALKTGTSILQQTENVEFLNSLQVIWAERFIYAKTKKHLEMPRDMLLTNPELKKGLRAR